MSARLPTGRARAWLLLLILLVALSSYSATPAGAASEAVVAGTGGLGLWLKAAPDFSAARIAALPEGLPVQVLAGPEPGGNDRVWAKVRAAGDTGWVVADFLSFTNDTASSPPTVDAPAGLAPGAWAQVTGTFPTTGLRLRAAAAPWNDLLHVIPEGTVIQIIDGPTTGGNGNPWFQVQIAGAIGWVDGSYLIGAAAPAEPPPVPPSPPIETAPRRTPGFGAGAWVQVVDTYPASGLRLRAAAAPTATLLAVFREGSQLRILAGPLTGGDGDPWYRVTDDDVTGWVSGVYLTASSAPQPAPPPTDTSSARGGALVASALKHVGKPYGWGATGPDRFDCSGFVLYVVRETLGMELPRVSQDQAFAGYHVDKKDLIPGDLVFFADTYEPGVTHVGIYVGNNRWIAAQDEYTGVIVASLDDPYWKVHYFGARRIT